MSEWWHRFIHRMCWQRGRVVSWTTAEKRIMIGFECSKCGRVTGPIDATRIVDRDVAQVLRVAERKGIPLAEGSTKS